MDLIALDIGSSCIRAAVCGGDIMRFPTLCARGSDGVCAVGESARICERRLCGAVSLVRPISNGVIVDSDAAAELIAHVIGEVCGKKRADIICSVPYDLSEFELSTLRDVLAAAGARNITTVEKPLAAAAGAHFAAADIAAEMTPDGDLDGVLICDIGAGTIEIGAVRMTESIAGRAKCINADIAAASSLRLSGDDLNEAIASCLRRDRGVEADFDAVERLKCVLACAVPYSDGPLVSAALRCVDSVTGLEREIKVAAPELDEPVGEHIAQITHTIIGVLEQTPNGFCDGIRRGGMIVCGGGSAMKNISDAVYGDTGLDVFIPSNAYDLVINGLLAAAERRGGLQIPSHRLK
ncbi:MAG: rod shape-determining protein [Eubacteriales bacterium]